MCSPVGCFQWCDFKFLDGSSCSHIADTSRWPVSWSQWHSNTAEQVLAFRGVPSTDDSYHGLIATRGMLEVKALETLLKLAVNAAKQNFKGSLQELVPLAEQVCIC